MNSMSFGNLLVTIYRLSVLDKACDICKFRLGFLRLWLLHGLKMELELLWKRFQKTYILMVLPTLLLNKTTDRRIETLAFNQERYSIL